MLPAAEVQVDTAAAVRELASALTLHEADPELLGRIASAVRGMAAQVREAPRRPWMQRMERLDREGNGTSNGVPCLTERPVGGLANPSAVGYAVRRDEDEAVVTDIVVDEMFQGGEGRVHGGIIAGLFDDVTGHLLTVLKVPGVTGRLTVHYRSPTPTGKPLVIKAWLVKREGRRMIVAAEIRHGDTVCATAEALYIEVDRSRFIAL